MNRMQMLDFMMSPHGNAYLTGASDWVRSFVVNRVFPWVVSRAGMLFLATCCIYPRRSYQARRSYPDIEPESVLRAGSAGAKAHVRPGLAFKTHWPRTPPLPVIIAREHNTAKHSAELVSPRTRLLCIRIA